MFNPERLLANICAQWGALMRARTGFFSAVALALLLGAVVGYLYQAREVSIKTAQIEQLRDQLYARAIATGNPYRLTSEQWVKFIEAAQVPSGETYRVFVIYNGSCEECAIFAQHLLNRLALIPGWESSGGAGMPDPLQEGLLVQVRSKSTASKEAMSITRALQAAGLNAVIDEEPVLGESAAAHLFIGIPQ